MNTLIIFSIIFVITCIIIIVTEKKTAEIIGKIFASIFIFALLYGFTIVMGRLNMNSNPKYTKYEYKELPIQSLINKSGFSINGSFVLGTGAISGKDRDYYVSYASFPQGLLRIRVDASNTFVKETNDETPKIINYWIREIWLGYESNWFLNSPPRTGEWQENKYGEKIVIVPEGTVYKDLYKIED